jgi:hypothetical protein
LTKTATTGTLFQYCGAESQGAENKLPPRAGAEIMICGSGSFLFIKDKEILKKKIMVAKEVFVNYNFNPIWVQHASIHVKKYCQGII